MATASFANDDGWPYADTGRELADPVSEPDWDLLSLHTDSAGLLAQLDPVERSVLVARFGLGGGQAQSMKDIRRTTGLDHDEVRAALGSGLAKLRAGLSESP
jgi:DNA-directed RNA polymerase sigma subunit (sigma70/sigma32)